MNKKELTKEESVLIFIRENPHEYKRQVDIVTAMNEEKPRNIGQSDVSKAVKRYHIHKDNKGFYYSDYNDDLSVEEIHSEKFNNLCQQIKDFTVKAVYSPENIMHILNINVDSGTEQFIATALYKKFSAIAFIPACSYVVAVAPHQTHFNNLKTFLHSKCGVAIKKPKSQNKQ